MTFSQRTILKHATSDQLHEILSGVLHADHSSFYTDIYAQAGLTKDTLLTAPDLKKIPLLHKNALVRTPPDKRLFIPKSDISFAAYTSGTTSGAPLVMYFSTIDTYHFNPSLGTETTRPLIIYPPLNKNFGHTFIQQCRQGTPQVTPIFADYQHLANSAVLAAQTQVDALYATPTLALNIAKYLDEYYDPTRITLLALGSETLTQATRTELHKLYPQAVIANLYASSEVGQYIMAPCSTIMERGDASFHLLTEDLVTAELVDGELIVTYTKNKALPLIRYCTGDEFEVVTQHCACGQNTPVLKWLGRKGVDKLRIAGMEIQVDDIEQAFYALTRNFGTAYQFHFYTATGTVPSKIQVVIEVVSTNRQGATDQILGHLLEHWRLTPTLTLADVIQQQIFAMPKVQFVKELTHQSSKTRRIVNHIT